MTTLSSGQPLKLGCLARNPTLGFFQNLHIKLRRPWYIPASRARRTSRGQLDTRRVVSRPRHTERSATLPQGVWIHHPDRPSRNHAASPLRPDRFVRAASGRSRATPLFLVLPLRPSLPVRKERGGTRPACRPPPCHFAPDKGKVSLIDSFGLPGLLRFPPRPALPASQPRCRCSLQGKSVREHLQRGWDARRWHLLVGVRWERFQCRVAAFYFQRVSLPVRWWLALGRPAQFRPRLPWWQQFVLAWLRLSGRVPAPRRRPPWARG